MKLTYRAMHLVQRVYHLLIMDYPGKAAAANVIIPYPTSYNSNYHSAYIYMPKEENTM